MSKRNPEFSSTASNLNADDCHNVKDMELFPLYQNTLCNFMNIIKNIIDSESLKPALLCNIYIKYLFDSSLSLYALKGYPLPPLNDLEYCVAKVYTFKTGMALVDEQDLILSTFEQNLSASVQNFQQFSSQLMKLYELLNCELSQHHEQIFMTSLSYALTKIDFFGFKPHFMIRGCLEWLSQMFEIQISAIDLINAGESGSCAAVFTKIIKEIEEKQ